MILKNGSHSLTYEENELAMILLTDWFARKNVDDTVIVFTMFISITEEVCLIAGDIILLQSGSVFYQRAI